MMNEIDLKDFIENKVAAIPGWLNRETSFFTTYLLEFQNELSIKGDIVEFGVFKGKYLSVLNEFAREGEKVVGYDIFPGKQEIVLGNVRNFIAGACKSIDNIELITTNTCDLTADDVKRKISGNSRFVSVDGGHTVDVAYNDLQLAGEIIGEGGILAIDDVFGHSLPGVTEAFMKFLFNDNKGRLASFATCYNKTFMTTVSHHQIYLKKAYEIIEKFQGFPTYERTKAKIEDNKRHDYKPEIDGFEILTYM